MMNDRHPTERCRRHIFPAEMCLAGVICCFATGCQQKMADQPAPRPLDASSFFADGQSARQLVAGTVSRGHLQIDAHLYTGREQAAEDLGDRQANNANQNNANENRPNAHPGQAEAERRRLFAQPEFVETFPFPVTEQFVEHGYHRFMIYCVVCHDPLGEGRGKIVERGYVKPPSFHEQRLRDARVGQFFAVMTEGYGAMPSYGDQIPTRDRWAIAAYIRALQLSQRFPVSDLTDEMKQEMAAAKTSEKNGP